MKDKANSGEVTPPTGMSKKAVEQGDNKEASKCEKTVSGTGVLTTAVVVGDVATSDRMDHEAPKAGGISKQPDSHGGTNSGELPTGINNAETGRKGDESVTERDKISSLVIIPTEKNNSLEDRERGPVSAYFPSADKKTEPRDKKEDNLDKTTTLITSPLESVIKDVTESLELVSEALLREEDVKQEVAKSDSALVPSLLAETGNMKVGKFDEPSSQIASSEQTGFTILDDRKKNQPTNETKAEKKLNTSDVYDTSKYKNFIHDRIQELKEIYNETCREKRIQELRKQKEMAQLKKGKKKTKKSGGYGDDSSSDETTVNDALNNPDVDIKMKKTYMKDAKIREFVETYFGTDDFSKKSPLKNRRTFTPSCKEIPEKKVGNVVKTVMEKIKNFIMRIKAAFKTSHNKKRRETKKRRPSWNSEFKRD